MKRFIYFFGVATLFFIFSCAGLEVKRGVQDNVFYSSSFPNINLKIDPDLKFSDKKEINKTFEWYNYKQERYIFKNDNSNKFIVITINEIIDRFGKMEVSYLTSRFFLNIENRLDSGTTKLNDDKYHYCVYIDKSSSGNCYLKKTLMRLLGSGSGIFEITYIENISYNLTNYLCSEWENAKLFKNDQKSYLEGFIKRSEKNYQILE
jgi:hypothetical protein